MALINCPRCGKPISEYAPVCPNCGRGMKPSRKGRKGCGIVVMALLVVSLLAGGVVGFLHLQDRKASRDELERQRMADSTRVADSLEALHQLRMADSIRAAEERWIRDSITMEKEKRAHLDFVINSVKTYGDSRHYVNQPDLGRFIYVKPDECRGNNNILVHVIDLNLNYEFAVRTTIHGLPRALVTGENDGVICLFAKGSNLQESGKCFFSRIDLEARREAVSQETCPGFVLSHRTEQGFVGNVYSTPEATGQPIATITLDFWGNSSTTPGYSPGI